MLFVTHNIALVRNIAQRVAILEAGRIVEYGEVEEIFANPKHAYTKALIADTPQFDVPFAAVSTGPALSGRPA